MPDDTNGLGELFGSEDHNSKEPSPNDEKRVRRLDRSVYKRSFDSFGVRMHVFDTYTMFIEEPVINDLIDLQDALPCETRSDVVEYLMAYWASEGRLEEDYDFVRPYSLDSYRETMLKNRNV